MTEMKSFEERTKEFETKIKPICEELGVAPWAVLRSTNEAILSVPAYKDLWDSGKES